MEIENYVNHATDWRKKERNLFFLFTCVIISMKSIDKKGVIIKNWWLTKWNEIKRKVRWRNEMKNEEK